MCTTSQKSVRFSEVIAQGLQAFSLPFTSKTADDEAVFDLSLPADNVPGIQIRLIIDEDGDCRLRSYLASNVPDARQPAMFAALNSLNAQYRYICLSVDQDGDVCASYDFSVPPAAEDVFARVFTTAVLYTHIADKCIPDILCTFWAGEAGSGDRAVKAALFSGEEDEA